MGEGLQRKTEMEVLSLSLEDFLSGCGFLELPADKQHCCSVGIGMKDAPSSAISSLCAVFCGQAASSASPRSSLEMQDIGPSPCLPDSGSAFLQDPQRIHLLHKFVKHSDISPG